jgi:copper resistance protein B
VAELGRGAGAGRRRALQLAAAALLALAATAAQAQRLEYRDLFTQPPPPVEAPRLPYADLNEDVAASSAASSATTATAAAGAEAGSGAVREYYLDQMEVSVADGSAGYAWDVAARIGGPRHRIWLETIGEGSFGGSLDYLELQALYSRPISASWDVQAGLRYDVRPRPNRAWFMFGAQGDATDALYVGVFGFVSHRGEAGARLYGLYDIPLAGPLILQPSAEVNFFAADIPELGLGRGLSYGEAGLRLRYRIRESFSPYLGVEWTRDFGRTARFTREAGEDPSGRTFLIGLRSWF